MYWGADKAPHAGAQSIIPEGQTRLFLHAIGTLVGPAFSSDQVVDAVETIIVTYLEVREEGERFLDTFRRLGTGPFKEKLYAAH